VRRPFARFAFASAFASAFAFGSAPARAGRVVDRIVAVVGDDAILLSELRRRAAPYEQQMERAHAASQERLAALHRELCSRMVDEHLVAAAAREAHLGVSGEEIARALRIVAERGHLTEPQLLAEVARKGVSPDDYRAEIGREILRAKLVQLRVRPKIAGKGLGEAEQTRAIEREEKAWLAELRARIYVDVRL
jgi:peptidyl-prolyl cis-trans isomerase SurA